VAIRTGILAVDVPAVGCVKVAPGAGAGLGKREANAGEVEDYGVEMHLK